MKNLRRFTIPILGLSEGEHRYEFEIDHKFFSNFEGSLITEGKFIVTAIFLKQAGHMEFDFEIKGSFATNCDRCFADINLPIELGNSIIVKISDEPKDDFEIVYIKSSETEFNIAKYIYEFIVLGIPFSKSYDCASDDPRPCDDSVLDRIDIQAPKTEKKDNPVWDILKDFNKN